MRYLKLIAPYFIAAICAVGLFAVGAYCGVRFTSAMFAPKFAQDTLIRTIEDQSLLAQLDANKTEKARSLLILRETGNILSLNLLSAEVSDETANSACHLMRAIAKRRATYPENYLNSTAAVDPEVAQAVSEALKNPVACTRPGANLVVERDAPQAARPSP